MSEYEDLPDELVEAARQAGRDEATEIARWIRYEVESDYLEAVFPSPWPTMLHESYVIQAHAGTVVQNVIPSL